ncbi:Hsp20/alpha crystallin family protein, partial [Bacteroides uniformis]
KIIQPHRKPHAHDRPHQRRDEHGTDDKKYLRREFSYSKFQQTILLPENVEKDKISAKVEHGILSIEIPKMKEEEKQKTFKAIEVK